MCIVTALTFGGFSKEAFPGGWAGCNKSKNIPVMCFKDWGFLEPHVGDVLQIGASTDGPMLSHGDISLTVFADAE